MVSLFFKMKLYILLNVSGLNALLNYLSDEIIFQASESTEEFMQKLPQFDPDISKDAEEVSISMIF